MTRVLGIADRPIPAWWAGATCRSDKVRAAIDAGRADFLPAKGRSAGEARAICADCPVRAECLDWAIAQGNWLVGIWGGESQAGRRRIAAARAAT